MVLCLLQEEEERLGQPEQGWWESFETFYVALIGLFVKSCHVIYIHIIRVLLVEEYQGG